MGPYSVAHHPGNPYPWRQLENLGDEIAVQFEICEDSLSSEDGQRYVTGLEIFGESWERGESGEGGDGVEREQEK